ncbi:MAG: helix-turn-helix transcriptional regulator [Chloroflexi bacterium]|nr:helix-turn-helix transcriptional regulator [Chloroflexota bacterium]
MSFDDISLHDIFLRGRRSQGVTAVDPGLSDLGRFSEPALLILISLAHGPKHGYAMMEDIAAFAGVRLGPGTLYGALARLETQQLIEPLAARDRRRPYRLTGTGADTLRAQLESMARVAHAGLQRLAAR